MENAKTLPLDAKVLLEPGFKQNLIYKMRGWLSPGSPSGSYTHATVKRKPNGAPFGGAEGYFWLAVVWWQSGCESAFILSLVADRLISILWATLCLIPRKPLHQRLHWCHQPPDRRPQPANLGPSGCLWEDLAPGGEEGVMLGTHGCHGDHASPSPSTFRRFELQWAPTYLSPDLDLMCPVLGKSIVPKGSWRWVKLCFLERWTSWILGVWPSLPYNLNMEVYWSLVCFLWNFSIWLSLPEPS